MAGLQLLDVDRPGVWFSNEEGYVNSLEEVKEIIENYVKKTVSALLSIAAMLALVIREVYHVSFIMYKISFCGTSRLRTSDGGNATFILSLLSSCKRSF